MTITLGPANKQPFQSDFLFPHDNIEHSVFTAGTGPGVILMHELPGMTPEFWRLANWLAERFTVWAPDLFGKTSTPTQPNAPLMPLRVCIGREIHLFSKNDPGPITQWLRALSKKLDEKQSGRGIGVIGMCLTGNFAISLAVDPWVNAPVTSQPAMPISIPLRNLDDRLQMSNENKSALTDRDVDVMGLRFDGDRLCKAARFSAIKEMIGEYRFKEHIIPDKHRSPDGPLKYPHSVLTADLVDEDDSVTKQKLLDVIQFIEKRIK
jgi:dienelactone hydrolase